MRTRTLAAEYRDGHAPSAHGDRDAVGERVAQLLAPHVGGLTARAALKTFALKSLGRGPETLERADVPVLLVALRPLLRAFVGRAHSEVVIEEIQRAVGP